jgi:hypothetical protein
MVMTTSAAWTISSVHGFGNWWEVSIPRSAMAAIAAGFTSMPGPRSSGHHPAVGSPSQTLIAADILGTWLAPTGLARA